MYHQLCVFLSVLSLSWARIGFVKDQRIDKHVFPPNIIPRTDGVLPTGHLRPLGWQKSPRGKIMEEKEMLKPQEFFEKYVEPGKPVVFRGAIKDVPAMEKWSKDEYLRKTYGELDVHIVTKKQDYLKNGPLKVRLLHFIKEYNYEDWYLSNTIPQEMMEELVLPTCLKCGFKKFLYESEIWMSSGGTSSLLHSHADHNLHCLVSGRKDFILIEEKHKDKFDYIDLDPHPGAGRSPLDMDQMNMFTHGHITQAPWHWATLLAGDCIYVPAKYLHQVRSFGRSFSSTMQWVPTPDMDFKDCEKTDLTMAIPLNEVPFIWTYTHGDRELTNIRLNAESLRHHLLVIMRDEPALRYAVFRDFFQEIMSEIEVHPECHELWAELDPKKKRKIKREEIKSMDAEILQVVAKQLNYPHTHTTPKDEL